MVYLRAIDDATSESGSHRCPEDLRLSAARFSARHNELGLATIR